MTGEVAPGPPYLAFDTSTAEGSVAVEDSRGQSTSVILAERDEHAARLLPTIDEVLDRAGVTTKELNGIVVGEGPGSFTGVRVAAATAKGLSGALGVRLWSISSLAAAALAHDLGPVQYVLFDARGDRVYGACYKILAASVETVVPPHGGSVQDVLRGDLPGGCVFVGPGSLEHREAIERAGLEVRSAVDDGPSLAHGLLRYMAIDRATEPVQDVAGWEPRYVRASSAEREWGG